jgi:hypothetical protein
MARTNGERRQRRDRVPLRWSKTENIAWNQGLLGLGR